MVSARRIFKRVFKKSIATMTAVVMTGSLFAAIAHAATAASLTDITKYWAESSIRWAVNNNIVTGYPDGTFQPNKEVTQAEFLTMLLRAYSPDDLPNVPAESSWDERVWQYANQLNWDLGERYQPISRGGVATIIGNSLGYACSDDQYIQALYNHGLSNGKYGQTLEGYAKQESLKRAEAVVFIQNMLDQIDALQSKPSKTSANCPVIAAAAKQEKQEKTVAPKPVPVTAGNYTLSSKTTDNSKLNLKAKFTKERSILVRVTKDGVVEKEAYESANKSLDVSLYFRQGPGQYLVEIFEKDPGAAGSYKSVLWADTGFMITNTDSRDMSYLLPTTYVQSDHPKIIALMEKITKGLNSDSEKTKAIHDWVAKNIAYDVESYFNNVSHLYTTTEILDRMKDVCSGYVNLTVALNRAAGIKAKFVIGTSIWSDQGETWKTTKKKDNHAWVEAYVDGKWIIQDPTWDAGYLDAKTKGFKFSYSEKFYDPSPSEFAKTHRKTEDSTM